MPVTETTPQRAMYLVCCAALALSGTSALAGGYDTGERDWDFVFLQDKFAAEAGTRYIDPQRHISNPGLGIGIDETTPFSVYRLSVAGRVTDNIRCMASYRQPWEGHADYGTTWDYTESATEQHFSSSDYGVTCVHTKPLALGQISILGGVSYQEIEYELKQINVVPLTTNVGDGGVGWRAGFAYEIPQYALRTSFIVNSAIDYDLTGTHSFAGPVYGSITMPSSMELRAQSGIAPGWLAFGSIALTDWSVAQNTPICSTAVPNCNYVNSTSGLALYFRDTWTITTGAAHQVSDMLSVAGNLTWAQGASQGFTSQTDVWTAGLTAILTPGKNAEIKLGGTVGILTAGSLSTMTVEGFPNPYGYTASFGNDLVYSLQASGSLKF